MRPWDPEQVKNALDLEMHGFETPDPTALAKERLVDAVPLAVESIVHLAVYSENEGIRSKNAQYIIDQVFGKANADGMTGGKKDELVELLNSLTTSAKN